MKDRPTKPLARPKPVRAGGPRSGKAARGQPAFEYIHSLSFPGLLRQLQVSLLVSTYQAGKLMMVSSSGEKLSMLLRSFDQPMGIAVSEDRNRIAVGTRREIWELRGAPEIAPKLEPVGTHDMCYVPGCCHVTGDIRNHEMAWCDGRLWFVNTRFSCLCTLDPDYSFVPQWRPPFIDQLAAEDRCHLNGLAVMDGRVKYVTALGRTNAENGWRENKVRGGILMNVDSSEVIADGLCMPHSPRWYRNTLYVLNSGQGQLAAVDVPTGRLTVVAEVPGYARGLAFFDQFAFIGLSRIRQSNTFGGLPIADRLSEKDRQCGVWVVDLETGETAAFLSFQRGSEELFDVQVLPKFHRPTVVGLEKPLINGIFIAPPGSWEKRTSV